VHYGFIELSLSDEYLTKVAMRFGTVGINLQPLCIVLDRLIEFTSSSMSICQVTMCVDKVRLYSQCLGEVSDGFVVPALVGQSKAEIIVTLSTSFQQLSSGPLGSSLQSDSPERAMWQADI
jgi:hypothetical protein